MRRVKHVKIFCSTEPFFTNLLIVTILLICFGKKLFRGCTFTYVLDFIKFDLFTFWSNFFMRLRFWNLYKFNLYLQYKAARSSKSCCISIWSWYLSLSTCLLKNVIGLVSFSFLKPSTLRYPTHLFCDCYLAHQFLGQKFCKFLCFVRRENLQDLIPEQLRFLSDSWT